MSEQVGSIYFDLDLDDAKFDSKLASAEAQARTFSSRLSDYFGNAVEASKKVALGLGVVSAAAGVLAGMGVHVQGNIEAWTQGFVTLLGSTEAANAAIKQITKDAAATPFTLPGLIQANLLLTGVTKNAGQSETLLLNVGKALAAMGKGQPELDRIIVNLQQIGAVGHASMVDIKQFAFAGIPIFDMLSKATGKTGEALSDMISNGEVTFGMLEKLFNDAGAAGGQFADAFTNQAGTFNQLWSNMGDVVQISLAKIVTATGIFGAVKKAISGVVDYLSNHQDTIVKGIVSGMQWISEHGQLVAGVLLGALLPAILAVVGSIISGTVALAPFILLGVALVKIVPELVQHFGGLKNILHSVTEAIHKTVGAIKLFVGGNFSGEIHKSLGATEDSSIVDRILKLRESIIAISLTIKNSFVAAWQLVYLVIQFLKPSLMALWSTIQNDLAPTLARLWELWVRLYNFIQPILVPLLKMLAVLLGGAIVASIFILINVINVSIKAFSFLENVVIALGNAGITVAQWLIGAFMGFWNFIFPIMNALVSLFAASFALAWAIASPFINLMVASFRAGFAIIGAVITGIVGVVLWTFNTIRSISDPVIFGIGAAFSFTRDVVRGIIVGILNLIRSMVDGIRNISGSITSALTSPFTKAFDTIKNGASSVGKWLNDHLNPFTRHSPSLVDWVKLGTQTISDQYAGMFQSMQDMATQTRPAMVGSVQGGVGAGTNVSTQIFGGVVINDRQSGDDVLRKISYDDKLTSMGLTPS